MILKRIWLICFFLVSIPPAHSAVIYVKADSTGTSGSSWSDACPSLQTALAAAKSGDEIWVAKGTYKPTTGTDRTISFVMKDGVNVYGGFFGSEVFRAYRNLKAHETILSGDIGTSSSSDNSYHVVIGANGILDGFTITGGFGDQSYSRGGGLLSGDVFSKINNCKFINNYASSGGGGFSYQNYNYRFASVLTNCQFIGNCSYIGGGSLGGVVIDCLFMNNEASGRGGGAADVNARNCVFTNNIAVQGGGMNGDTATSCTFLNNVATQCGGGVFDGTLSNCMITSNSANTGGGICACEIQNCIIINNIAKINGGGGDTVTAFNSVIANNSAGSGGGLHDGNLTNCTVTSNTAVYGGGIRKTVIVSNTIVWNNFATSGSQINNEGYLPAEITHCSIQSCVGSGSNWDAAIGRDKGGNISDDPEFVNSAQIAGVDGIWFTADDGLQLKDGSPCINTASFLAAPVADILGNARVSHIPDMGAYENQTPVPMAELAVFDGDTRVTSSSLVNFGAKVYGTDLVKTLIVKNIGTADLVVSNTTASAPFRIDQAPSPIIAPGTSSTLVIAMQAKERGTYSGLISLVNNDPASPRLNFYVTGQVLAPILKVTDRNGVVLGNGGSIRVRSAGLHAPLPDIQLAIKNIGDASLTMGTPAISRPFRVMEMPALNVNATSVTTMRISLDTRNAGTFGEVLSFSTNDPNLPEFSLTVNGIVQDKPKVLYVRADSKSTSQTANFGESWATAYPDLQLALKAAKPGNEIWIAAGTYKPAPGTTCNVSFVMPEDVGIYGGFTGTEMALAQRDWRKNQTVLNGDVGTSTDIYQTEHLIIGANGTLDGLTITKGRAWGTGFMYGGGMLNEFVSPIIMNCVFSENKVGELFFASSEGRGGAICNISSSPMIKNCVFNNNTSMGSWGYDVGWLGKGGAVYSDAGSTTNFINCVFINNGVYGGYGSARSHYTGQGANGLGGAIYSEGVCSVINSTFNGNCAIGGEGADYYDKFAGLIEGGDGRGFGSAFFSSRAMASLTNCIIRNDTVFEYSSNVAVINCDIQGCGGSGAGWKVAFGTDGGGNISSDPKFVNIDVPAGPDGIWATADDGLRLRSGSRCIDGGTNMGASGTDILGQIRCNRADMGAYENRSRNATGNWALYR
ncbi:MAG: choice-of-anchor Q domain-containing protein [Candidatus Sumerlaeia bacterium]